MERGRPEVPSRLAQSQKARTVARRHGGEEVGCELVVVGGDAPEVIQPAEGVLDQVAIAVAGPAVRRLRGCPTSLAHLRRQLHRWSIDNEAALADALPEMLPGFRNRVAANWNLLLAIAESAGVPWKHAAWQAATAIERVLEGFDASLGAELIRNIRSAFEEAGNPACLSSDSPRSISLPD
jgi:hypothetical protein